VFSRKAGAMTLTPDQARSTLAAMRISIGVSALLAPRLAGRLFGLRPDDNPESLLLGQLFGVRNAAIGVTLIDGTPDEQRRWLRYGLAIEAADIAAVLAAGARGRITKPATALITATAGVATVLGVLAQRDD
jgi:hypothetical protein